MSELFYVAKPVYSKGIYSNCESSMLENDLVITALKYIRHIVRKSLPLMGLFYLLLDAQSCIFM